MFCSLVSSTIIVKLEAQVCFPGAATVLYSYEFVSS